MENVNKFNLPKERLKVNNFTLVLHYEYRNNRIYNSMDDLKFFIKSNRELIENILKELDEE